MDRLIRNKGRILLTLFMIVLVIMGMIGIALNRPAVAQTTGKVASKEYTHQFYDDLKGKIIVSHPDTGQGFGTMDGEDIWLRVEAVVDSGAVDKAKKRYGSHNFRLVDPEGEQFHWARQWGKNREGWQQFYIGHYWDGYNEMWSKRSSFNYTWKLSVDDIPGIYVLKLDDGAWDTSIYIKYYRKPRDIAVPEPTKGFLDDLKRLGMNEAKAREVWEAYGGSNDIQQIVRWYRELMLDNPFGTSYESRPVYWHPNEAFNRTAAGIYRLFAGESDQRADWGRPGTAGSTCGDVAEYKWRQFYQKFKDSGLTMQGIHRDSWPDHGAPVLLPKGKTMESYTNYENGAIKPEAENLLVFDSRPPHITTVKDWRNTYLWRGSKFSYGTFGEPKDETKSTFKPSLTTDYVNMDKSSKTFGDPWRFAD